ncbi:restriction endonuclease subunit S [Bacillus sp. FSL K6-2839]|uniref:restriction endonuclease subunit S n=1 Tax=Bacillus sp. FSL K6-2839 TaxID=2921480 RepID=UPI0030F59D96
MSNRKKTVDELLEEAKLSVEEQPYEVPQNWLWITFGTVAKLFNGYAFKSSDYQEEGIPIIRISDISGENTSSKNAVRVPPHLYNEKFLIKKGDLLIAMSGATTGKTGVYNSEELALQNQRVGKIKEISHKVLYSLFMKYFVFYNSKQILKRAYGGAQPNISGSLIEQLNIALPPLKEQKRIADKVERLISKMEEAKQLIEEAKETFELRRAAILDKAFRGELTKKWREQNPNVESGFLLQKKIISELKDKSIEVINEKEIPATWKVVKMGEVVQVNPKKKKLEDVPEEQICTFIPMPAVSDKTGEIEEPEEREYSKVKKGYTFFEENDVLFAKITPCMENGKAAIAKNLKNGFGFGSTEFHVLRTSECINETYIHYFVRSKKFRLEAKRKMTGAVGQQRVPKEFLINYPLPLPPKEEQDVIVRTLSEIFSKDHFVEQSLHIESKLELIKQSILSKAFRGELGTNNPSEENSIELLKAILQEQVK